MEVMQYVLAAFLVFGIPFLIIAQREKNARKPTKPEKNIKDMTQAEKAKKLALIEQAYRHGDLTFAQYDAIKAKYTGTTSISETFGVEVASNINKKVATANAAKQAKKAATKAIVKDAIVGGVVAGPAGAVVGAVVGKNKVDNEKE